MTDLRELEKAATPAPWTVMANGLHQDIGVVPRHKHASWQDPDGTECPDCRLTAATRNALPFLLDVVEAAEQFAYGPLMLGGKAERTQAIANKQAIKDALAALDAHLSYGN